MGSYKIDWLVCGNHARSAAGGMYGIVGGNSANLGKYPIGEYNRKV